MQNMEDTRTLGPGAGSLGRGSGVMLTLEGLVLSYGLEFCRPLLLFDALNEHLRIVLQNLMSPIEAHKLEKKLLFLFLGPSDLSMILAVLGIISCIELGS